MNEPPATPPLALVIDDEPQIRRLLRLVLEGEGYRVVDAATGTDGLQLAAQRPPDAILLDLGLPDLDGLEVLRRLREWSAAPIVVLSVRDQEETKVAALDQGAHDYVTKPFSTAELLARIRAARRHVPASGADSGSEGFFSAGEFEIDYARRQVRMRGAEVRLSPTEYQLLRVLTRHAGRVLTHRQLLTEVWGPNVARQEPTHYLRVYVGHLREKLEPTPATPRLILTEPGIGYRFVVPEPEGDARSAKPCRASPD